MSNTSNWQPAASLLVMQQRARMLQQLRAFFSARQVLEVETPLLSQSGTTDPHIESFHVIEINNRWQGYLHTSPEFAMKRLLAAGSGAIYQVCKVFRCEEQGTRHNPEFTMLEWYRPGFDHHQLMGEVDELVRTLLADNQSLGESQYFSYQAIFERVLSLNPHQASVTALQEAARQHGFGEVVGMSGREEERDSWLELLMSQVIEPALPRHCPVFIYDFPASQASLARIRKDEFDVAERFELYINGMELANGFHELTVAGEQRQRFYQDNAQRTAQGQKQVKIDEHLLSALEQGLPCCAGVALGLDRILMLISGESRIDDVLAFPFSSA